MLCIGNQMVSSAIWNKKGRANFSKTTTLHEPARRVQVFKKFASAYLFQIAQGKQGQWRQPASSILLLNCEKQCLLTVE